MNSYRLVESWKGFMQFIGLAKQPLKSAYDDELCLSMEVDSGGVLLILYKPSRTIKGVMVDVVAGCRIKPTELPCVPDTFQVASVYVEKEHRGKGLGPLIYKMAFYVANEELDGGLTSDQNVSSKPGAIDRWRKFINKKQVEPRETEMGNDEFDYSGQQTPEDTQDDCERPKGTTATNKSWKLKDMEKVRPLFDKMTARHEKLMKAVPNSSEIKKAIFKNYGEGFIRNYPSQVLGGEK